MGICSAINQRRNELEPTIANDGENANSLLRGLIGKYDIHVMKIAACLHLSNDQDNSLVHDDRVSEAMAIVNAYIGHIRSLIKDASIIVFSEREKAVLNEVGDKPVAALKLLEKLSRRNCFRGQRTRDRAAVQATIEQLCERDFIRIDKKPSQEFKDASILKR